ncbi:MAG: RHS repeat-associated core domain-containing protein [Anaerofustis stercorihominis]|nr:RHS repeat-associated core domain-containing protein [Anaerofustis stercorihominis]
MKLVNASGTVVAEYEYDDWGKLLVEESSLPDIGRLNPIRYRSHYYDTHSKLYYLNSRYYDPETGRFINADAFVFTGLGISGHNMFVYCVNNPINKFDSQGYVSADFVSNFSDGMNKMSSFFQACQNLSLVDGGLPLVDVLALAAAGTAVIGVLGYSVYETFIENSGKSDAMSDSAVIRNDSNSAFYGADTYGRVWKTVTPRMDFGQALFWVSATSELGLYGKGASWGVYTSEKEDALTFTFALGGGIPIFHEGQVGQYDHFHVYGYNLFGKHKHFHVWYGGIK